MAAINIGAVLDYKIGNLKIIGATNYQPQQEIPKHKSP
jgi:hypothetical protein